jgi:hypothetical protein
MSSDPTYPLARWGFVVLGTNLPLTDDLRKDLLTLACRTYLDDETSVDIDWEGMSGRLTARDEAAQLGTFIGQRFVAEVDTDDGRGKVDFLVTEAQLQWAAQTRDAQQELLN